MSYRSLLLVCLATLGLAVAGWGQADGKIAFTSWREGAGDVWIMNADGSAPVNLTQGRHADCERLAWSPDGTKIAYRAFSADPDSGWADYSVAYTWVMDADGGNPQQLAHLTENRAEPLFWAEDGSSIYSYLRHPLYELFLVPLDGSGSSLMDWRDAAGIVQRFLDNRGRSPDGTKQASVSFLLDDESDQTLIFIDDIDEDGQIKVTRPIALFTLGQPIDVDFSSWDPGPNVWSSHSVWAPWGPPAWAPNGMRVAFNLSTPDNSFPYWEIWAVDIDGSNLVNLTNGLDGFSPVWQPVSHSDAATSIEAQSWGRIKELFSTGTR